MIRKTQNPYYKISEIDNLFFDLHGFYPTKEGQSYELLVGSVLKILDPDKKIIWDEKVKGEYDKNNYQIDVSIYIIDQKSIMVEAKDHTKHEAKVSRPEIDKIAGSLIEVNYETGYFFSATDYTKDARKKSEGSKINPNAKCISLFHLRKSLEADNDNRLKTFILNISMIDIDNNATRITPLLGGSDVKILFPSIIDKINISAKVQILVLDKMVECYGQFYKNLNECVGNYYFKKYISDDLFNLAIQNNLNLKGKWDVDEGYVETRENRINLNKVQFDIGFKEINITNEIKSVGIPKILVKSDDEKINKLITDKQLKGISFEGEIKFDGSKP